MDLTSEQANKDLDLLIIKITDKVTELYHYITEYEILFNEIPETQEIIEEVNSRFFYDLYVLYWNYITIKVCALVDKKTTGKNENLTIPKLLDSIEKLNLKCSPAVKSKLEEILNKLKPFSRVRNKSFAHFDLQTIVSGETFEAIKLDELISICSLITDILNKIARERGNSDILFGYRSQDGAMKLLHFLRMGVKRKHEIINKK